MRVYWTDKRPNGQPITSGFCMVTDLEDGTHPIYTYGETKDEVYDKVALMNANAQTALSRRPANQPPPNGSPKPQPAARQISPDQVMQATADLTNPAKAGEAVATLLEHATGVDPRKEAERAFAETAERWVQSHPEFYAHPANRQLMANRLYALSAGKLGMTTSAMFDEAFQDLQRSGVLVERPATQPHDPSQNTLNDNRPGENPAPNVIERPRGTRFATGANGLRLGASQIPQRTPKYTEEQIRTMPEAKARELIQSNDPDYAAACEHYFGRQSA